MEKSIKTPFGLKTETVAFIILTGIALFVRLHYLSADPPLDLAYSSAVYTDPAQYISFARNLVLWGDFNPLHDFRLVFFLKSAVTVVSFLVFKVAGVGYVQANLVGLLFSFTTLMLFYFIVRRLAGNVAALCYLLFIAFDYNQIFFGRYPFLENSMTCFTALAVTILLYTRRGIWAVPAGISLGIGIFFSKMIGLVYLFPFVCFMLYEYYHDYRDDLRMYLTRYAFFWAGMLAVTVFWYYFSYRPMMSSVEGYLQEQALGLYGSPDGLKSVDFFLYKYMTFGATSKLFQKMPAPALLAWAMILIFFYRALTREGWKSRLYGIGPGTVFLIALTIATYGALMIWNYRPLRYQTMLIYPICGLAGILINDWLTGHRSDKPLTMSWFFPAVLYFWALIPVFQLIATAFENSVKVDTYYEYRVIVFVVTLVCTGAVVGLKRYMPGIFHQPPRWAVAGVVLIALAAGVGPNAYRYGSWHAVASFTSVAAAKDLDTIVSPEAIISGPYAARLTQDNKIRNLIHMFGVANVDSAFFRRYPVTHLLLDKANEESARADYPDIMDRAILVTEYRITNRLIKLYRVAGATGNITANHYQLSDYERFQYFYSVSQADSAESYLHRYLDDHPDNMSANLRVGVESFAAEHYDVSGTYLQRAVDFSPTDFHLHYKLAVFYIEMYALTRNPEYADRGITEAKTALRYNPTSKMLAANVDKLYEIKDAVSLE
ncbi:MAG: glycosyltransferase family 39 protein [candidate division Zixibacteria bacterium]|nr:glycosyltransferase family 39 protein [candidate division Zixibacteria bacterium]